MRALFTSTAHTMSSTSIIEIFHHLIEVHTHSLLIILRSFIHRVSALRIASAQRCFIARLTTARSFECVHVFLLRCIHRTPSIRPSMIHSSFLLLLNATSIFRIQFSCILLFIKCSIAYKPGSFTLNEQYSLWFLDVHASLLFYQACCDNWFLLHLNSKNLNSAFF